jgi:hypothetical protein
MKVTYTVQNQFGETVEYSFRNPMKSRSKAIEQLKLFRGEAKSYKGLRLSCNIDGIQTIDLITGKRMHSDDILKALANELEILANLDLPYEMPACFTELDDVAEGWSLLSKGSFSVADFESITHIWFSHEHPDHFCPPILQKIPLEVRKRITVLFHKTIDKKVVSFCQKMSFGKVVEMEADLSYEIGNGLKAICNPYHDGDSWAYFFTDEIGILNLNDCILRTQQEAELIKQKIGRVDILMTQFGYANKIGEPGEDFKRREAANEKLLRIQNQATVLAPKYIIPFASFVFFCHEENIYMNNGQNTVGMAYDYIVNNLPCKPVVMYPDQKWELFSDWDSSEALEKYNVDYEAIKHYEPVKAGKIPLEEVKALAKKFGARLVQKNPSAKHLINSICPKIYVTDYNGAFSFKGEGGLQEINLEQKKCDVALSSEALSYIFKHEWGGGTFNVNGRFLIPPGGDFYRFNLFIRMSLLNNNGLEYKWSRPSLLNRILTRVKSLI